MDFKVGDKVRMKPIHMFGKVFYQVGYLVVISVQGGKVRIRSESTGDEMEIQPDKLELFQDPGK